MPRTARNYYDVFDAIYRACWGTALHHGWYEPDVARARPAIALARFQEEIVERLRLKQGMTLCDVGCGYGDFSASLVRKRVVASAVGITNSVAQVNHARRAHNSINGFEIIGGDWLDHPFPTQSFDRLIAIESLYHFADECKPLAIRKMARVLRPGGRAVVTVWLRRGTAWWAGAIDRCMRAWNPGFGSLISEAECRAWFGRHGLRIDAFEDVTTQVRPAIPVLFQSLASMLWVEPSAFAVIARDPCSAARAGIASTATWLGYATGVLRYGVAVLEKQ